MRYLLILTVLLGCDAAGDPDRDGGGPFDALLESDVGLDAAPPDMAPPEIAPPPRPGEWPRFAFPIHPDDRGMMTPAPMFGVDHDPAPGDRVGCRNRDGMGFPTCYDGHDGSDFVLQGGFVVMDRGSARIVAAAGGEVIEAEDGHYDRCRGSAASADVDCDGHPMRANRVKLRHANGWTTWYFHMKTDSVAVAVGDQVACGHVLGRVGSSGYSSLPHLHFEVVDPGGDRVDPFAGELSQPQSLWVEQEAMDRLPGAACDPAWGPAR